MIRPQNDRQRQWLSAKVGLLAAITLSFSGCTWHKKGKQNFVDADLEHYKSVSTQIEYPDVEAEGFIEIAATPSPVTLAGETPVDFWDMKLEEAVRLALKHSKVLRDLGGLVLQAPDTIQTIHSPALRETDPRFGVEGALSAFDAEWTTQFFFEKNDRALNNQFFGGGTRLLQQDLGTYRSEIFKRSAIGTEMAARHNVEYDFNNSPGNDTPNRPWTTNLELEMRQPVLNRAGADFNRIAGPGATPGIYNGVMIARVNTDISLADFELGVRNLVNDVEIGYWELYFAYRDLDARIGARDRALETWRRIHALFETGRRGGEAEKEAQAREQYFRLEEEVQNALSGRIQERSRATTFRGTGGIYHNERRLRLMIGLPVNDCRLIRPCTEPDLAKATFCWQDILAEALTRRVELRAQKWKIKRRQLELIAARNFLLPQLDVVGRYRWRGLGHDLVEPNGTGRAPFSDAVQNLVDGRFQEWQLGFEFAMPVGFRQANAAVRNAKLHLARDHAVLREQQREVSLGVSNAVAEKDRAYVVAQTSLNRRTAANEQLAALEAVYEDADENQKARLLDLLLDAQRRLADAESSYYRALVEYMLAIKQVHYAKGSLLDYNEIYLSEGPWPHKAYHGAIERDKLRMKSWQLDNFVLRSHKVSRGIYDQGPPSHQDIPHGAFGELPQDKPEELPAGEKSEDSHEELPAPQFNGPSANAHNGDRTARRPQAKASHVGFIEPFDDYRASKRFSPSSSNQTPGPYQGADQPATQNPYEPSAADMFRGPSR